MKQLVNHNFPPFYQKDSKVLILGSIPSTKSRELGFYYMHPKNRFWKVISEVFEEENPKTIEDKKIFLKRNKIALWDVISSCDIEGSSDSSISNVIINDIESIVQETDIQYIYVLGKKALQLYEKYIFPTVLITAVYLPSTSPRNARLKEKDLIKQYQVIKTKMKEI